MTQTLPCLIAISSAPKCVWFPFREDKITIGCSSDMTYRILSKSISPCHAIIEKQADNTWTITDTKSLSGVSVNNRKLKPLQPYTLQDRDMVQLGHSTPAEFVYRFFSAFTMRKVPQASPQQKPATSTSTTHLLAESDQNAAVRRARKRKCEAEEKEEAEEENKRLKTAFEMKMQTVLRQLKKQVREKAVFMYELLKERQKRRALEKRQKEQEKKIAQMCARQPLAAERAASISKTIRELEEHLTQLRPQMERELQRLVTEKKQMEKRLRKDFEKTLRHKDQEMQEQRDRLQKVIEGLKTEQKALEFQLADVWVENEMAKEERKDLELQLAESWVEKATALESVQSTQEAILSKFANIMKTELQCSICNELFVKATSLNCSHTFCGLCIRKWLTIKKQCPYCREEVTSHARSVLLDNYIACMVEEFSEEMKQRRAALVAERKEAEAKLDEAENEEIAGPSRSSHRRRRPRRRRRDGGDRATGRRSRSGSPESAGTVTHDSSASFSSDDEYWEPLAQPDSSQSPFGVVFTDTEDSESEDGSSSSLESTYDFPPSSSDLEEDSADGDGGEREHHNDNRQQLSRP